MKTETFIDFLAQGAGPAPRHDAARKFGLALTIGLLASIGAGWYVHGISPGSELLSLAQLPKSGYALALAAGAWGWLVRLARPVSRTSAFVAALIVIGIAMLSLGVMVLLAAPRDQRSALFWGETWQVCAVLVALCSLPTLAGVLWALRSLAPTRLRYAGFAAGVFSGAVGALGYSLGCPETSPLFIAVWYTLGIALSGLLGMCLGPRVLRW